MSSRKKIRIGFADFWDSFNKSDNFITDALKENFEIELSDKPDFVFCGTFGRTHLKYSCVKIFFTGENLLPDFNLVDYGMGFHEITFGDRYLRLPLYVLYNDAVDKALDKHNDCQVIDGVKATDRKFCNYVISNAIADPARDEMIRLLTDYREVASGGRYMNNVGGPVPDKIAFERAYKFTMCFENTCAPGYTTEKIVEAFAGKTVPIVWGSPDVATEFNPDAFINCHDYASLEEVMEEVKRLDEDDEAYMRMLESPILKSDGSSSASIYLKEGYLADYLKMICSQEPADAIRRNRIYQGLRYEQQAQFHQKIDRLLYVPRRAIYFLQNKLRSRR